MTALYQWFAAGGVNSMRWDLAKLLVQFGGAIFIAWFAVWLALRRFKSEKGWERQTSTFADLLVAIDEMHSINDGWLTAEMVHREISAERQKEMNANYKRAFQTFEKSIAMAAILLPRDVYDIARQLHVSLTTYEADSRFDEFDTAGAALGKAQEQLIAAGRKLQA